MSFEFLNSNPKKSQRQALLDELDQLCKVFSVGLQQEIPRLCLRGSYIEDYIESFVRDAKGGWVRAITDSGQGP